MQRANAGGRLHPEVTRSLYVRNLPFEIGAEAMYELFGKFGAVRQIRVGTKSTTKGTAYVVYEDIYDAHAAMQGLSGYNVNGRYLILVYHNASRVKK